MTTKELTEEQRENILKAKDLIYDNFSWGKTEEGLLFDYWSEVYKVLNRIANSKVKKFCSECGREIE